MKCDDISSKLKVQIKPQRIKLNIDKVIKSLSHTMAKKRATLSHEVTKGESSNSKMFFFVIFVAPCEKLVFYEIIKH